MSYSVGFVHGSRLFCTSIDGEYDRESYRLGSFQDEAGLESVLCSNK